MGADEQALKFLDEIEAKTKQKPTQDEIDAHHKGVADAYESYEKWIALGKRGKRPQISIDYTLCIAQLISLKYHKFLLKKLGREEINRTLDMCEEILKFPEILSANTSKLVTTVLKDLHGYNSDKFSNNKNVNCPRSRK